MSIEPSPVVLHSFDGPSRREFLRTVAGSAVAVGAAEALAPAPAWARIAAPKSVAAIVTEYRPNSHADVIVSRWLEGLELDGKSDRPLRSRVVSLFLDQTPANDIGKAAAEKHKVPIYGSIKEALCRGGEKLAVDGVLLIGEHGNYPNNEKGQKMYPRRRFFEETAKVFAAAGRSVPTFADKHLAYNWENAKWIYDKAAELKVPFMAGSSVPTAWRIPPAEVDEGSPLEEVVVVAHGGLESYGYHALEAMQAIIERRKGGETGVAAVQCLEGDAVWKAADEKKWSPELVAAALKAGTARTKAGDPRKLVKRPAAFVLEYKDGLKATVLMLGGITDEWIIAAKVAGKDRPFTTCIWLQPSRPYGHFAVLVRDIDALFATGKSPRPLERTLLATGLVDAVMCSHADGNKRLETPHLAISYKAGPAWKQPPAPGTGVQPPG